MSQANGADPEGQELPQQLRSLQAQMNETRAWCASLEQQQAQLAAVLALVAGSARRGLTRFPFEALGSMLLDQLTVHGEE